MVVMQQLLQLKTEEPQNAISTDSLLESDLLNESFEGFTELKDLLPILFKSSFFLELKEETKSLDITLNEDEKKLILKLKKKTKSKSLSKKGRVYALRKEWKMASLTFVYNLQQDYGISNELQPVTPIEPIMNVVRPLDVAQPKTMISDLPKLSIKSPILVDNPDDINMVLPLVGELLQELPKRSYEEEFKILTSGDIHSGVKNGLNTDIYHYGPEKLVRPEDLVQKYKPDLIVQTPTQNFEGQLGNKVQFIEYDRPRLENGEFIYEEIRMRARGWTTVYDLLRQSGVRFSATYNKRFNSVYIQSINGVSEGSTYWEFKINGQYANTPADKALVPPGAEVTWVRKTARRGVCGEPIAG